MKSFFSGSIIKLAQLLLLASLTLPGAVWAAKAPIGIVLLAVGEVSAQGADGVSRALKRRSEIFEGDTLSVEQGARTQLRFSDGSLLSLPESSQFRVDEYRFNADEPDGERAIYTLLKGGMRTLTGAIGKKDPQSYRVNTPVATIGIRGTAYHAYLQRLPSGEFRLFGGVKHGLIVVENAGGASQFSSQQNFRVTGPAERPGTILRLPDFYPLQEEEEESAPNGEENGSGEGTVSEGQLSDEQTAGTLGGGDEPAPLTTLYTPALDEPLQKTEQPITDTPPGQPAPVGSMVGISFVGMDANGLMAKTGTVLNLAPNQVYLDSVNGVGNVPVSLDIYDSFCSPCTFVPGTATLVDTGGDATLGVNWGRWEGDFVVLENGVLDQTSGSFHYIYTPNLTPLSVVQARTGFAYYQLDPAQGTGTAPTDQNGNVGILQNFSIDVDFDNQQITSVYLGGSVGTTIFNASSTAVAAPVTISDALNPAIGISIEDSSAQLSGRVDMQFVGSNAEAIAASYGLQSTTAPSQTAISGTALLREGLAY
jgi:hypothetical protein